MVSGEPLAVTSPLWRAPNLLITPHTTPRLSDRDERAFAILAANVERWLADEALLNRIGPDDVYTGPTDVADAGPGHEVAAAGPSVLVSRVGLIGAAAGVPTSSGT